MIYTGEPFRVSTLLPYLETLPKNSLTAKQLPLVFLYPKAANEIPATVKNHLIYPIQKWAEDLDISPKKIYRLPTNT